MNKIFVSTLAASAFMAAAAVSQGATVTYQLLFTTPYTTTGVPPTTTNDPFITDFFAPAGANPKTYATPTVLKFGDDNTSPGSGAANSFAAWKHVPISFDFKLDLGPAITATAHEYTVTGFLDGKLGYDGGGNPYSTADVIYTSIKDDFTGTSGTLTLDPQNKVKALEVTTKINGVPISVWIDTNESKAAPGEFVTHTGFVATPTPEPGTVAMIVGIGVSGGVFLRRKRRA